MSLIQPLGGLRSDKERFFHRQRTGAVEPGGHGLALEFRHRDEDLPAGLFDRVDGANVGMVDSRRRKSLVAKALPARLIEAGLGKEFECDGALKPEILGLIDHAHAALSELGGNPVVADGGADHLFLDAKGFSAAAAKRRPSPGLPRA